MQVHWPSEFRRGWIMAIKGQSFLKAALLVAASVDCQDVSMILVSASPVVAIMKKATPVTPMAVMTLTITVIMDRRLATSALVAAGSTITIIPAPASFCSTPFGAAILCGNNIAVTGVSGITRAIQGTNGKDHRIVKKAEHGIVTTTEVTAGEIAMARL